MSSITIVFGLITINIKSDILTHVTHIAILIFLFSCVRLVNMKEIEHPSGRKICYNIRGGGKPILFIHGWGSSSLIWNKQIDYFSKNHTVITIDLSGHGSSSPNDEYSLDGFSDDIMFFINSLKLWDITVVGWSMGGMVTIKLLTKLKKYIESIVLVSSTPKFISDNGYDLGLPALIANKLKRDIKTNYPGAIKTFYNLLFKGESNIEAHKSFVLNEVTPPDPDVACKTLEELERADLRNYLATIEIPALIIHGGLDEICRPQASEFMHKKIKKSVLKIIPNAAHAPFLTQSDLFNTMLMEFIR